MPFSKEAQKIFDEWDAQPPAPQSLLDKMQGQAEVNDILSRPGQARDDYLRISAMSQDELLAEFPGVLCADAYDEEDEEIENDPETDPALLEDRTMETYQAMEERDAKAWERRHRRE